MDFDDRRSLLPAIIMKHLGMQRGGYLLVVETLRQIFAAHEDGQCYDPSKVISAGRGAKHKIADFTPQADVVYRSMACGMSLGRTIVLLNQWRRRRALEPISYGALQNFVATSEVMDLTKRETRKAGSTDASAPWATARLAFSSQLMRQFHKAERIGAGGGRRTSRPKMGRRRRRPSRA